jgi:SAM-dependent methyltransferase
VFFDQAYANFTEQVLERVREAAFGEDIGQNSWVTVQEYDEFLGFLRLTRSSHVLEVASGSGGPATYLAKRAGCRVTGMDSSVEGVDTASRLAAASGAASRLEFHVADATQRLPFPDGGFDGLICIDSMNHFPARSDVLREWHRVLRPGGRAVFTDPVVITGAVTNEELAQRSSIGLFVFVPRGMNEELIAAAGFKLVQQLDLTANRDQLLRLEGGAPFESTQKFLGAVQRLTSERRLSRLAYFVEKM